MKKIVLAITVFLFALILQAQQLNSLYFLENSPGRHLLNPAFQPTSNFYFGLPVISNIQLGYYSNFPTYKTALFPSGHVINVAQDRAKFVGAFSPMNTMDAYAQINLLDVGFRLNSNYWTLTVSSKADINGKIPRSMMGLLIDDNILTNGFSSDLTGMQLRMNAYTEAALGFSRDFKGKFGLGVKAKLLYGNSYLSMKINQLGAGVNGKALSATADLSMLASSPLSTDNRLKLTSATGFFPYIKPYGLGGAIDLGVYYKPMKFMTLSLAATDIGMINWSSMTQKNYLLNYQFSDADANTWVNNHPGFTDVPLDSLMDDIRNKLTSTENAAPSENHYLSPRINAGIELGILKNKLSLGILSRSLLRNQTLIHELTGSLNIKPVHWMNMGLSYSVTNGNMSNVGLGLSIKMKKVNLFLAMDYIPVQYVGLDLQQFLPEIPAFSLPLAYNSNRTNFAIGLNYVLGSRKDADMDGIDDKFDRCPDTPMGVKVDRRGCPVDSDKDGVSDYLDKCPDTPKEALNFIGTDGCALDTDGDSIPDFMDNCPNTPERAKGYINDSGCPKDTDQDGVWDYLDKCPETPLGIEVDSLGCPIDSDGDEVPDYLDLCANTPYAARGFVDKNGCPTDLDDDGVLDYLDLCPETPVEARGYVDINGCLKDTDDDGVPDYRDECKDTPIEARGMVDHRGCPKDSDFDGIPDYKDDCPKVAGVAENKGCPEVKREVKTLIQKAVQGIQFEKDTMAIAKSSFETLNQIVTMMKQNDTYLLEIQGHTDNLLKDYQKKALNLTDSTSADDAGVKMKLSLYYAGLIRDYFVAQGIDEKRLFVKGFGDTKPLTTNDNDAGKSKNKRVELVILFENN